MLNIVTENKGIRFLLSCLLFRIWRGDFDESFEKTPLDWELSEDGPEALVNPHNEYSFFSYELTGKASVWDVRNRFYY